ncbi:MAG: avidin/streptavidin family protein [Acetobacteraceae bacterium]
MTDTIDVRTLPVDGTWRNDAGSELVLRQEGARLTGSYRTRIGAADTTRTYELAGWRDRRCLGFTVSWAPESESLTSWTALLHLAPDGETVMEAMWLLVSATTFRKTDAGVVPTDTGPWEAFRTQAVSFRRVAGQDTTGSKIIT